MHALLFDPARHEPLVDRRWDADAARAAIAAIVDDTLAACSPAGLWPPHPLDLDGGDDPRSPFTTTYMGAAGVIWALDWLSRAGASHRHRDFAPGLSDLLERNVEQVTRWGHGIDGLLIGRAGVLLLSCRLAPSAANEDRLAASIAANTGHSSQELLWGTPGTMHAALEMYEQLADERWAELFRRDARALARSFSYLAQAGCHLWTQDLYGRRDVLLGAAHGFAGNAGAIIRGLPLLSEEERTWWIERIVQTANVTALRHGAHANWPPAFAAVPASTSKRLVQWCHGAPGIVTSLGDLQDARLDELLLAAGELIWAAGPLTKGAGLCHGTAGNGWAFLKLFRRTGDDLWLDRARAFAMHAIDQNDRHLREYRMRRHSLFTGDPGLAIYLWNCVTGDDRWPIIDRTTVARAPAPS